jgi:hypothetical protein
MPVTGVSKVNSNIKKAFKDIRETKSLEFMNAVINGGVAHSKELTPIAYSNLINSIVTDVSVDATGVMGTVFYMAEYALYLNGSDTYTPLWNPVKAPKYAVKGTRKRKDGTYATPDPGAPADNMDARPRFLNRGFEDPESQNHFKQLERIFKV